MGNNRTDTVVSAIVASVRDAIREQNVTFEEYRAAIGYLVKTAEAGELPLMIDMFFNATVVDVINQNAKTETSPSDMEGPYFLDNAPFVDGKIKTMEEFGGQPMLLRGSVQDTNGQPVADAVMDIWSSTPDGKYSGIHDNIPVEYYRGKVKTGANGEYSVESTVPVPYTIPNTGPCGHLLEMMGKHSWRPAHVHFKIRKPGFQDLTTQAYFEGGEYVNSDCCEGIVPQEFVVPDKVENGARVMDLNFVIQAAA
ncbi:MAG: chlorocatechol 1,2-dioxygenase [Pseudomonadota bacterium]